MVYLNLYSENNKDSKKNFILDTRKQVSRAEDFQ